MQITGANDTAIALDLGAGSDYAKLATNKSSAGGVVEDVILRGAKTGLRVAVTQALFKNVAIEGSTVQGLHVHSSAWSLVALNLSVSRAPLGVVIDGTLPGAVQLLDCKLNSISNFPGITTNGKTALLLQNLQTDASVTHVVDHTLPRPASGVVPLWGQGQTFRAGKRTHPLEHRGALPLPTLAEAAAQGIPLACTSSGSGSGEPSNSSGGGGSGSGAPHLCGGSQEDPSTGAPYIPRPLFGEDEEAPLNVLTVGVFGDGKHDETKALQAAISSARTVFIPFGIYMISGTLILRPDSRIVPSRCIAPVQ